MSDWLLGIQSVFALVVLLIVIPRLVRANGESPFLLAFIIISSVTLIGAGLDLTFRHTTVFPYPVYRLFTMTTLIVTVLYCEYKRG